MGSVDGTWKVRTVDTSSLTISELVTETACDVAADQNIVDWTLDAGAPRPAGDHFHVYRNTSPTGLLSIAPDPWTLTTWDDSTPASPSLPRVHFYKIFAADLCEQEQDPE